MSLIGTAVLVGGIALLLHTGIDEIKRKGSEFNYSTAIDKESFEKIIYEEAKTIKRLTVDYITGPVIHCSVKSNSGITTWKFKIDFNDYGKLTGNHWISSKNSDSEIPKVFAERIEERVRVLEARNKMGL